MRSITIITILAWVFQSCNNSDDDMYITAPQNKYIVCRGTALYLNDGKKWKTNPETTEGIDGMLQKMNNFNFPSDTIAYHTFADSLMNDYSYILQHCEYMGNAHELVHAYLYPMQELIMPMQIGGEITCENLFPKLKEYLEKYHEYFE
ncbi:MAG: hypothetical protein ACHQFW_07930 [Chitinophagales bacterium]